MRLIDADTLMPNAEYKGANCFVSAYDIVNAPTIDAVEVVRCKDCKWGRETCGNIECNVDLNVPPEYHSYDWFCPNGERRANE